MHFLSLLLLFFFPVLPLTLAAVTPTSAPQFWGTSVNEYSSTVQNYRAVTASSVDITRRWTNARRLAAGLPPKPPRVTRTKRQGPVPSSTPPQTREGYLLLSRQSDNTPVGYISSSYDRYGGYGLSTSDLSQALRVRFDTTSAATVPTNIQLVDASYPVFGAAAPTSSVQASDFGVGRFQFASFGGTYQTDPGATAVEVPNNLSDTTGVTAVVESAIFRYDPTIGQITAQWINSDGSLPTTSIGLPTNFPTWVITGDEAAFMNLYGPVEWLTLKFVPADSLAE